MEKVRCFFDIHIVWVRGHDKTFGNEKADKHAGEGAEVKDEGRERQIRPNDWGFFEFRRDFPHHFAQAQTMAKQLFQREEGEGREEADPSMEAKKRKIVGRMDTGTKRKQAEEKKEEEEEVGKETSTMPTILEIQTTIAEVAATCGRPPKRFSKRLSKDNEAVIMLEEAIAERSMSTDGLERFYLNRRVERCRRKVRRLTATANAEFIINNPRMPRRRVKGGPTKKSAAKRSGGRG